MNFNLRTWQEEARRKAVDYLSLGQDRHFVIDAAPGAGKTMVSCVIAHDLLRAGKIDRVIIIAPRRTVVSQWATEFNRVTGRHMMQITGADTLNAISVDVCATWAAIKSLSDVFQHICSTARVMVICDEHHHAAVAAAWGNSADSAFARATYSLILSGTPVRADGAQLLWLDRNAHGSLTQPEAGRYTITYGEAVSMGYCRPVSFHRHRGHFTLDLGPDHQVSILDDEPVVLPDGYEVTKDIKAATDFYRLACRPQFEADGATPQRSGYQGTMILCASEKLDELRLDMPHAGGLVIAPSVEVAEHFAALIKIIEGQEAIVVHSRFPNAQGRIETFRNDGSLRWLVSVGMINEGVDIPRLRVLVMLPKALTELAFRQAVGRVVRNDGHKDSSRAYVVMPCLKTFDDFARRIEADMPTSSISSDAPPKMKRCRECGTENTLGAFECTECNASFPSRQNSFPPCPHCTGLNRWSANECQHCGGDLLLHFNVTLNAAARDGVISRGIEIDEDEVREAERQAPVIRARLAEVEDEELARVLRTIPLECYPAMARLFGNASAGQSDSGEAFDTA